MSATNQILLTDLQDEVAEYAYDLGADEAFDNTPHHFEANLKALLDTNDPFEYVNFLGFNDFSEYMAAKNAEQEAV